MNEPKDANWWTLQTDYFKSSEFMDQLRSFILGKGRVTCPSCKEPMEIGAEGVEASANDVVFILKCHACMPSTLTIRKKATLS